MKATTCSRNESIYKEAEITLSEFGLIQCILSFLPALRIRLAYELNGFAFVTSCKIPEARLRRLDSALIWWLRDLDFKIYYYFGSTIPDRHGLCLSDY